MLALHSARTVSTHTIIYCRGHTPTTSLWTALYSGRSRLAFPVSQLSRVMTSQRVLVRDVTALSWDEATPTHPTPSKPPFYRSKTWSRPVSIRRAKDWQTCDEQRQQQDNDDDADNDDESSRVSHEHAVIVTSTITWLPASLSFAVHHQQRLIRGHWTGWPPDKAIHHAHLSAYRRKNIERQRMALERRYVVWLRQKYFSKKSIVTSDSARNC